MEGDLEAASGGLTTQQYVQLTKMRNHFHKDVRKQLYSDSDDRTFFDNLKVALKVGLTQVERDGIPQSESPARLQCCSSAIERSWDVGPCSCIPL